MTDTPTDASDQGVTRNAAGRWLPGASPNPGGRPKGVSLASVLIDELQIADARKIIRALLRRARAGDVRAFEALIDRTDGRVPNRTQIGQDPDAEPVTLVIERSAE